MIWIELQYQYQDASGLVDDDAWLAVPAVKFDAGVPQVELPDLVPGSDIFMRWRALDDETDLYSDWSASVAQGIEEEESDFVPPEPEALKLTDDDCLYWQLPDEADGVAGFEVRSLAGHEQAHESGELLAEAHPGPPLSLCGEPTGKRTLSMRTVLDSGQKSDPVYLFVNRPDRIAEQRAAAVELLPGQLGWPPGWMIEGGMFVGEEAVADQYAGDEAPFWESGRSPFWNGDPEAPFWTADFARFWDKLRGGSRPFWTGDDAAPFWGGASRAMTVSGTILGDQFAGPGRLLDATADSDFAPLEISYRMDDALFWTGNDAAPFWSGDDTQPFWSGPGPWRRMPKSLLFDRAKKLSLRFKVFGSKKGAPILRNVRVRASAAFLEEVVQGLQLPAGGGFVPFSLPFSRFALVAPFLTGPLSSAVRCQAVDKNLPPFVVALDASETPVAATVDVLLKGY